MRHAPSSWFANSEPLELDLGVIKDLAEVVVNGKCANIVEAPQSSVHYE
jgi:hypothetical protein